MKHSKNNVNKTAMIFGILGIILCLLTRIFSGSPYNMIHTLDPSDIIPPIWLFNLLSIAWSFLSGYAAGMIVCAVAKGSVRGSRELFAYKGGLFFIAYAFLSLIWYPLFFGEERLFLSFLITLLKVLTAAVCMYFWSYSVTSAALIMAANALWSFYILLVNLSVILNN